MKKYFHFLLIGILFLGSQCPSQPKNIKLDEFVTDLSSVNVKLRGKLSLIGEFKGDMSSLTYSRYLELLSEYEETSSSGVYKTIRKADIHFFAAKKNSFLIALYSKELKVVLYDDASTAFTDSVKVLNENEIVPDLQEFISKSGYGGTNN